MRPKMGVHIPLVHLCDTLHPPLLYYLPDCIIKVLQMPEGKRCVQVTVLALAIMFLLLPSFLSFFADLTHE